MSCALCQRREVATVAEWEAHCFCADCLRRLGVFAATGAFEQRRQVWTVPGEQATNLTPIHMAARLEEGFARLGIDATRDQGVADFDVHAALALAYEQMGLHDDAICEMGQLLADPKARDRDRALAVVLDPRHLNGELTTVLRTLRELLFTN